MSNKADNLSNWYQKYMQLFFGQGARGGYMAAIDQGLISLSNFLATLLLARFATPTELGVYGVGFTILRLVRAFQDGLTIQPLNTFGAGLDRDQFKEYATSTTLIQIGLALLSATTVAALGWILTRMGNDTLGPGIYALWPAFLWWQLHEYFRRMLYTRGKIFVAIMNTAISNSFRLALMIWLIQRGEIDGATSLFAIAFGSLVALLPGLWFTRHYWSRRYVDLAETWCQNWVFGRWILGGNLTNWVAVEFYPVMTAGLVSFAAAGAYRAIQTLLAPIHLLLRAIDTYITPRAAKIYHDAGIIALQRVMKLTYIGSGIPVIGLLVVGVFFREQLLYLLYGETYLPYQQGVVLMAIFYALWYAYWPLQSILKAARISRPIFIANLLAIVAMFTVGIWLITQWGVFGTIGGQVVNSLIVNLVLWSTWRVSHLKSVG